jgi:hypothetical protein
MIEDVDGEHHMIVDVAGYDKAGKLRLIIEVKKKTGATGEWAAELRRNMIMHSILPQCDYFVVALADYFYLWRDGTTLQAERRADYALDVSELMAAYGEKAGVSAQALVEQSLEFVVAGWLTECIHAADTEQLPRHAHEWLVDSGLFAALQGGRLELEVSL